MKRSTRVVIDGETLTIDAVCAVAEHYAEVELASPARARMMATRNVVAGIVERNEVVYGVTTGFGKLSEVAIPPDRLAELVSALCFRIGKCAR